jgi:hypothetical protein
MSSANVLGELESVDASELPSETIQLLVAAAIKLYMSKRESGCDFLPVQPDALTATDVSVTALGLLRSAQLEPFELTLWGRFGQL